MCNFHLPFGWEVIGYLSFMSYYIHSSFMTGVLSFSVFMLPQKYWSGQTFCQATTEKTNPPFVVDCQSHPYPAYPMPLHVIGRLSILILFQSPYSFPSCYHLLILRIMISYRIYIYQTFGYMMLFMRIHMQFNLLTCQSHQWPIQWSVVKLYLQRDLYHLKCNRWPPFVYHKHLYWWLLS